MAAATAERVHPSVALARTVLPKGPYLVWGGRTGWIGQQIVAMLKEKDCEVHVARSRLEQFEEVEDELERIMPQFVINCAGLTGRPNVDWCESHKTETIRVNVIGTLNLLDQCYRRDIHVTNFATGCIFEYDDAHPIGGPGFTEEDTPNFARSFYSLTKGAVDTISRAYDRVLTLRVRMPISADLSPRNFITKITKYPKIASVPNSMTILRDMLPVALLLMKRYCTGIYNFTNPGVASHDEILRLYQEIVDPTFWWESFSVEECEAILAAGRSNNFLETAKIEAELPGVKIPTLLESLPGVMHTIRESFDEKGEAPSNYKEDVLGLRRPDGAN
jgi:3,5-epimerase/4-reductase